MLTDGKKIYIFDHEKAFSFIEVLSFFRNKTPWILESELTWIKSHFFWKEFKGKLINIDSFINNFIDSFLLLDNNFWSKAESLIPKQWLEKSQCFQDIKNHLESIVQNKDVFKDEIKRMLV